jgi:hypothetical protein
MPKTKQQYVIYCHFKSQLYNSGCCADGQPCSDALVEHHCQCRDCVVMTINTSKLSKQCCSNQKLTPWHGFLVKGLFFDESHDWHSWYDNIVGQHCNGVVHVESIAITSKPSIISKNAQNETTICDLLPLQKPTIQFWMLCWWTTMLRYTRGTSLSKSWPCGNDYKHIKTVQAVLFESKIVTVTRFFSQRIDFWWITRLTTVIN